MSSDPERQQRQQQWRRPRMGSAPLPCPGLLALPSHRYKNDAYVVNRTPRYRVSLSDKVQNWLRRTDDRGGETTWAAGQVPPLPVSGTVRELYSLASGFARVFPFLNSIAGQVSRSCPD